MLDVIPSDFVHNKLKIKYVVYLIQMHMVYIKPLKKNIRSLL